MKLRINKNTIISFLVIAMLLLPFTNMSAPIYLGISCFCLFCMMCTYKKGSTRGRKIRKIAVIGLFALLVLMLLQTSLIRTQYVFMDSLKICTQVYIGIIVVFFLSEVQNISIPIADGFAFTMIVFSLIYDIDILLHGVGTSRDSMFGIFSKNYCAALIYFTLPFLIYMVKQEKTKKNNRIYMISIILGVITVLLTGSRTSLGIVAVFFVIHYMYGRKTRSAVTRGAFSILGIMAALLIAYNFVPVFHEQVERALGALNGANEIRNDVRIVLWDSAIHDFINNNHIIGSGTNLITPFVFKEPVHNFYLEILLAFGIFGVLLFVWFVIRFFVVALSNYKVKEVSEVLIELILAFIVTSLVQPFFSTSYNLGIIIWLSIIACLTETKYLAGMN